MFWKKKVNKITEDQNWRIASLLTQLMYQKLLDQVVDKNLPLEEFTARFIELRQQEYEKIMPILVYNYRALTGTKGDI